MQAAVGGALIFLMVFYVSSWDVTHAMNRNEVSAMGVTFTHIAGSMQTLLEADRATVAIAAGAAMQEDPTTSTNDSSSASVISEKVLYFLFRRG